MEKVELILLVGLRLHHHVQLLLQRRDVVHSQRQLAFEVINLVLKDAAVCVVGRSQIACLLLRLLPVLLALIQFMLLSV